MMSDLFDLPPHNYRQSSIDGAVNAKERAATQSSKIYAHLLKSGSTGYTASELKTLTGIGESSTMSARLNRLMLDGKIIASDDKRKSEYGINQIVWKVKI